MLPARLVPFLERAVGDPGRTPAAVQLTQRGRMWSKPQGRPLDFTATQVLSPDRVAFEWRAKATIARGVWMEGLDRLAGGTGLFDIRLWGKIRVAHDDGPSAARGQALRYLAELPWVPYALTANPDLVWDEHDDGTIEVSTTVKGQACSLVLELDAAGDIVASRTNARPRAVGKTTVDTPWGGQFAGYRSFDGLCVPAFAQVHWDLPDGRFTYWEGEVTQARAVW